MAKNSLTSNTKRITVDFDLGLVAQVEEAARVRSTAYRRSTVSDIVREAVVRFLLSMEGTDSSHSSTDNTNPRQEVGSLSA